MKRSILRLCAALCFTLAAARAQRWQMQYFYDQDRSTLAINDLAFPSAQRGVAVGFLEEKDKARGTALVTSDGGARWSLVPLPEPGMSVYFLNDTTGWVVTPKGILQTDESGRSWHKLPKSPKDVLRVWFTDPQRGFAVGFRKSAWKTVDGGRNWSRLEDADKVKTSPEHTVFNNITFLGKVGIITGSSQPPRAGISDLPDWMEPEQATRRREWPAVSVTLETHDGGEKWAPAITSIFGQITVVRLAPGGLGLGLIEFRNSFPYPSEVMAINWRTGKSVRVYRESNRAVTDTAVLPSGGAYLAAIEMPGKLLRAPIPGRLHLLTSDNLNVWKEMEVDYRANARRAVLAAVDAANVWVATDTGMILKLKP